MALLILANLALAAAHIVAALLVGDVSLPVLFLFAPDFAWTAAVNAAVALEWAVAWAVGVARRHRAAAPGEEPA